MDPKKLLEDIDKKFKEFEAKFAEYGLEKLVKEAKLALHQEVDKKLYRNDYFYTEAGSDKQLQLSKKDWNERAFKLQYKKWLEEYGKQLKELKKTVTDLNIKEVLKPFLNITWDEIKIEGKMSFLKKVQTTKVTSKAVKQKLDWSNWHVKDSMLDGFSYDDLITAVQSNEKNISAETVKKTFKAILKAQVKDAEAMLEKHMKKILSELK